MDSGVPARRVNDGKDRRVSEPGFGWRGWFESNPSSHTAQLVALIVLAIAAAWLLLIVYSDSFRFVVYDPRARTGFDVFLAIGQVFGAFVLAMSPVQSALGRMRWVAAGLLVLGFGAISYGYIYPLFVDSPDLMASMYGSLYVRSVATVLCAVGLAAPREFRFSPRIIATIAALILATGVLLVPLADRLPVLIQVTGDIASLQQEASPGENVAPHDLEVSDIENLVTEKIGIFPGLTAWFFVIAMVPLAASIIATWGSSRRISPAGGLGLWLVIALALLAGAQLHSVFWPSIYGPMLSTASLLRLAVAVVVVVGGIFELRSVIHQRDRLLLAEQERIQRLEDLAQLKADFTSIVAHELGNPVAAIKAMAQVVALDGIPNDFRQRTADDIAEEARMLELLVQDIRETATIERDDFRIDLQEIPVDRLVAEASAHARRLPGVHYVTVENLAATLTVLGDPDRIGQVVRNLLNNAARYTPDGTPIVIRTRRQPGAVAFEVADSGQGISPEDLGRIFEKFGRGRGANERYASGRGLGLYLSRRIMRGHGSDLVVESTPGQGTVFRFTLKEVP